MQGSSGLDTLRILTGEKAIEAYKALSDEIEDRFFMLCEPNECPLPN